MSARSTNYFLPKDRASKYGPIVVYITRGDENKRRRMIRHGWVKTRRDYLVSWLGHARVEQLRAIQADGAYLMTAYGWTFKGDTV